MDPVEPTAEISETRPATPGAGSSWEIVLERAGTSEAVPLPPGDGIAPAPTPKVQRWLKLAFPALVLLVYVLFKLYSAMSAPREAPALLGPTERASLTGVQPAHGEFERIHRDRQLRDLVAKLEGHAARNEWKALAAAVAAAEDPRAAQHPVVRGLSALARTRSGERSLDIESDLIASEAALRGLRDYVALSEELRAARVDQAIARTASWEILARNTDLFHQLLGPNATSPYQVTVRQKLARRYESAADEIAEKSRGIIKDDILLVREARSAYQSALRWLVTAEGWRSLTPVSTGVKPDIERLTEKIRLMNRAIHGPQIPFTNTDATAWTGRAGNPVHFDPASP